MSASQIVTCPECGTVATATVNRRDSDDFCRSCDYPLFWVTGVVVRDEASPQDESLRRLPGTVGRAASAAVPCPHCAEPNLVSAATCVRCGLGMRLAPPPAPPPEPEVVLPPPVVAAPPDERTPWWVWLLLALAVVGAVLLGVVVLG